VEESKSLVSGEARTCCIAGLGNPGVRYEATPHNFGFLVVDELAKRYSIRISRRESCAFIGGGQIQNKHVVLVKPQTFMNNSGAAIGPVLTYRNLDHRDLIVVYDELDLPWSALRIKKNGSAAGHNGVKSIIAALKSDVFVRVRVGIHPGHPVDAVQYVLAPFERELRTDVDEIVSYAADAVESIIAEGANRAMAKYNRRAGGLKEEER
jgi:PTH1 family peptidyl-tRNA hydrolase